MFRSPVIDEIRRLDPVMDHQRIIFLTTRVDFPFDTTRALEPALFRTFAVPTIAALLDRTREFELRAQKRYDDTDIIVSELLDHGYDSERGRKALRRMNQIHGRFSIDNGDLLYVLSTFVFEPIAFIDRYGWRRLLEVEKEAMFRFWSAVGLRMGIRDIPGERSAFEELMRSHERERVAESDASRRVGEATRELFAGWFPRPVRPLVRLAIHTLLDPRTRDAFGFPAPPAWVARWIPRALRARAALLRRLPRRRRPQLRTSLRRVLYPEGYDLETLGPPAA